MNPNDVREKVLFLSKYKPNEWEAGSSVKGILIGIINNSLKYDKSIAEANYRRHQVLAWLFRDQLNKKFASGISTKELTNEMWWCLYRFINPRKDADTGMWMGDDEVGESLYVCWRAMEDWENEISGQLGFDIL